MATILRVTLSVEGQQHWASATPEKALYRPSFVRLNANAAKAVLETKAVPRDPNAEAILKLIGGSKAELQPTIDIELQLPSQHSDAELKVYAQALKLSDIELLRKMLIVSEEVLRAGKNAQHGNE